jgi:hypothetical protein
MEFRGTIYSSLEDWNNSNDYASKILKGCEGYTSENYQSKPILTNDGGFILVELDAYKEHLKSGGFDFTVLNKEIIKINII